MTMPTPQTALALIVLLPLFTAIMNGLFGKFFSKGMVNLLAVGSVVLSFVCTVYLFFELREMKSAGVADPIISAHLFGCPGTAAAATHTSAPRPRLRPPPATHGTLVLALRPPTARENNSPERR